ncbi:MAG: tRNA preQ1(34) S-adenosylmethionine ribosyltransferase-isomerase QueA [Clostridiaceae bacterium]|jgi:S-adenosylmethionine:tRNA ribosyltransferase-isomerase|nr:tRNA preQ1(34) S-adenosylmethionine ribosyltransferase-isomerase QueA [Clostridiaceae bacterium]
MKSSDFFYELPQELIAQEPLAQRSSSRLLVLDRDSGSIEHKGFGDLKGYLRKGDCLVLNDTRVIPARLLGNRSDTGGKIEFVLLKNIEGDIWEVILKPGKRAKPGAKFTFGDGELLAQVLEVVEGGNRLVRFEYEGIFQEVLDRVGIVPLPPYITRKLEDPERYQTVYSKYRGSAAAPTAGLHFTKELLEELRQAGILFAALTLHVGLGTFRPVKVKNVEEHVMHSEYYSLNAAAADTINRCRAAGGRIVAVGTTSCRVLETLADEQGHIRPSEGWTNIFIYPGYSFKMIDALITNFHLPESTLIMLVSAFAGKDNIMKAYNSAVNLKYRFFSFGDGMLIK